MSSATSNHQPNPGPHVKRSSKQGARGRHSRQPSTGSATSQSSVDARSNGRDAKTIPSQRLSPSLIDLEHLSAGERQIILEVLERDEQLRLYDQDRVKKLKNELHDLRKKSAANVADENDNQRVCMRCREALGLLFGTGDNCPRCQHRVCTRCQVLLPSGSKWLCSVCHKSMQIELETGEWYYKKLQVEQVPLFGSDLVKVSLAKAKHSLTDPSTPPVLTAGDLQSISSTSTSSRQGKKRGVAGRSHQQQQQKQQRGRHDSRTSSESGGFRDETKQRSLSSGSERLSITDSSEVETAVVEPITGFTFQRVSFRRDHNTKQSSTDSRDLGKDSSDMGCSQCSEPEPACLPVGSDPAAGDGDYYTKTDTDNKPSSNNNVAEGTPVISVNTVEDHEEQDEDVDHHFMAHTGLTGEMKDKHGIGETSQSSVDTDLNLNSQQTTNDDNVTDEQTDTQTEIPKPTSSPEPQYASLRSHSQPTLSPPQDYPLDNETSSQIQSRSPSFTKGTLDNRSSVTSTSSLQRKMKTNSGTLTKGSSVSMVSLYSQAGEENYGKYVITGDIKFGLQYNYKTNVFEVKIKSCRDLAPVDTKKIKSDPYVKTYLLPDKTKASKRKTIIRKGTVNPQFDATLKYQIAQSELETRTLSVTIWNNDALGRNDFLGEVLVNMDSINIDAYKPIWHPLCNKSQPVEGAVAYKGDLTLSLMYSETAAPEEEDDDPKKTKKKKAKKHSKKVPRLNMGGGVLYVKIKEAQNLVGVRLGGTSNPFVKAYLEPDRSKTGKHKTAVLKGSCNPQWNHTIRFDGVTLTSLKERCLELTIWDHETLSSNEFLGGTRLNLGTGEYKHTTVDWNDAKGDEIKTWENMLKNPGKWTDSTIILRPSMVSQLLQST